MENRFSIWRLFRASSAFWKTFRREIVAISHNKQFGEQRLLAEREYVATGFVSRKSKLSWKAYTRETESGFFNIWVGLKFMVKFDFGRNLLQGTVNGTAAQN